MKKVSFLASAFLSLCLHSNVKAQFNSGSLFISGTTAVSIDGLVLVPDNDLLLSNKILTREPQAVTESLFSSIKRVYSFNEEFSFTGKAGLIYLPSELNSNVEATLKMVYWNLAEGYVITSGNTVETGAHLVFNIFQNRNLQKITAAGDIDPGNGNPGDGDPENPLPDNNPDGPFTAGHFFIAKATPVSLDGLVIIPSADLLLDNKTLTRTSKAVPGTPTNSINRVYTFNETVPFSGKAGIIYNTSELNGNTEAILQIIHKAAEDYVTTSGSMVDPGLHYVSNNFANLDLYRMTAGDGNSAYPVTLVGFTARKNENNAELLWSTAEETNSDYFEVQHSTNSKKWHPLGQVEANGESKTLKSYAFLHFGPVAGENLYRLKMVDNDGTFAFSKIRNLHFDSDEELNVYPNPVIGKMVIKTDDWTKIKRVDIYNASGKSQFVPMQSINENQREKEFNLQNLPSGIYLIKTTRTDGIIVTKKVMKK
ncbi:T9SS type A sorting domain-containing protein [Dyadobacter flavalbus]|uniref:T9SS type A sorting domain-containing protein n=1 Tax=Dyadobacter flavalbus TaxID=2579942 RepID=A0A5M8R2C8_9BACT|nr:T9SS type A sorting domain-containing protein [Dyadobacter flavalbus]KAA6441841.1 T9SS type A sorting domain-containing protein [Dyadobacter flavalbus]